MKKIEEMTLWEFIDKQNRDDIEYLSNRKKSGKYEISIYSWKEDWEDEPLRGDFILSCFVDNGTDLSVVHHIFGGLFYVLYDVKTKKKLSEGCFDDDLFTEIGKIEGNEWEYLCFDELPLDFVKRKAEQDKETEEFNAYQQKNRESVKMAETIDNAIKYINSVFDAYVDREQVRKGWNDNIKPLIALSKKLKNKKY